ncbi:Demethylrebeccamycin-D-glucose O-methyltransferase [Candidatus Methylomirabilis lanthanidiphila]|uniref:Demethylrebeccamycin-D-glucose O-methyltransferase n=1 Tax=Candidatus Methylomirabilis lanthanidiphila TaxID=2211376 RepID=A0A564ZN33_9BACT|nr:methyltransferase domain-containing protein [Candidatus Methylomirabilis lanthanidiphila]VUZ86052.1 Demethylrebeccamycin-D-glucose O-methyltransferase [Candidatus Methylomirabilis lanthanidiphila]
MFTAKHYTKEFRYFKEQYGESMERMFAAVSDLYAEYWNDFFHFALFKDDHESWESAFTNTHKKYLEALRIHDARHVLELACGRGGFTNVLAEHTSGEVLGIDISRSQLSHTDRFKRPNLRFKRHDIMKVDELGQMFDAVVCMDAECYLPDKRIAIQKISGVMEPGARLLLLGWCKQSGLNRVQEEIVLYPFMKYWAIPSLETPANYRKYFAQSDFKVIEITDLNDQVKRNWEFGYESALSGIKKLSRKDFPRLIWKHMTLGSEGVRLIKEQFPAAIYVKVGYDTGFLRYVYFLVEKQ